MLRASKIDAGHQPKNGARAKCRKVKSCCILCSVTQRDRVADFIQERVFARFFTALRIVTDVGHRGCSDSRRVAQNCAVLRQHFFQTVEAALGGLAGSIADLSSRDLISARFFTSMTVCLLMIT